MCLGVNRHLVSGHEISRLQHGLQFIMARYIRIINYCRPCCNHVTYTYTAGGRYVQVRPGSVKSGSVLGSSRLVRTYGRFFLYRPLLCELSTCTQKYWSSVDDTMCVFVTLTPASAGETTRWPASEHPTEWPAGENGRGCACAAADSRT